MEERLYYEDIICARATPPGPSSIAIIRISGKNSWSILNSIFNNFSKNINNFKSHKIYYGNIVDEDKIIDNVIVITFSEGKSFTDEESFEINCHGSEVIVSMILNLLISKGARLAEPGEFSKRAFLNNKIDLAEAESIMDLVNSSTKKSAQIAIQQLSGRFSKEINNLKDNIADILAEVEVNIDYPEDDLTIDIDKWITDINNIIKIIESLLNGFHRGRFFRDGIRSVILGRTNSGKSTLFNFLLNDDKAIVSDIHGTTRDFLDGIINIDGYGIRIYDTAGLRESNDPIEIEGIKKAIDISINSDIIIYIIDANEGLNDKDKINLTKVDKSKKILFVINKIDIKNINIDKIINDIKKYAFSLYNKFDIVKTSALNKIGLKEFNESFIKLLIDDKTSDYDDPLMTNTRHAQLLEKAKINLIESINNIKVNMLDIGAFELRETLDRLGEITGEITPKDILDRIFSSFCVGK